MCCVVLWCPNCVPCAPTGPRSTTDAHSGSSGAVQGRFCPIDATAVQSKGAARAKNRDAGRPTPSSRAGAIASYHGERGETNNYSGCLRCFALLCLLASNCYPMKIYFKYILPSSHKWLHGHRGTITHTCAGTPQGTKALWTQWTSMLPMRKSWRCCTPLARRQTPVCTL